MRFSTTEVTYILTSIVGGLLLYALLFHLLKRWANRKEKIILGLLNTHIYYPGLFFILFSSMWVSIWMFRKEIHPTIFSASEHTLKILLIGSTALLIIKIISLLRDIALHHFKVGDPLDYKYRKAKTKFQLIQRILNFMIVLTALAIILMTFKSIRQIGSTLLASAGLVGLVIGFAAQKSLGTLLAGIQIAISQPIRIDDVVIVEGQYGIVGEINLTYVIIKCWDGRRLTLPISYFLEKPFENWTRDSPEIIAKVKVYMDYSLPVNDIREKFLQWVQESPLWDGRACNFMVTSVSDKTMELRGIMSARDSGDAFVMECQMREKIITYVRENYPESLPKSRLERLTEHNDHKNDNDY
jgi:small-conductance mechanosensitive channel